jgi:methylated-DNA-[protein]-cysteine S-methyltransferase
MRTSTRPDDLLARGRLREEIYVCGLGVGYLMLADDLPVMLELPDPERPAPSARGPSGHWVAEIERYFAGEPVAFALDVDAYAAAHGFSEFERRVYQALSRVPYGEVVSYRELAAAAGSPNAYRAAGSAMARNALPVILPCHRVIRNDGRLGSYGDDPAWKERLLTLEGVRVAEGRVAP